MVLPVRFHRVDEGTIATEGAFAEHLRLLLGKLAPHFTQLTVAAPLMAPADYERAKGHLAHLDEAGEGIRLVDLHRADTRTVRFWTREFRGVLAKLRAAVEAADLVHAGTSHNLFQPFEFPALRYAVRAGKPTISVADIDLRREAWMNYVTGRWSRKSYLLCKFVYDPLRNWQLRYVARRCSLVLFKGQQLCEDFGRGRPQVKNFLDSAFAAEHILPAQRLEEKTARLESARLDGERGDVRPLELVYFGRLVGYKGVDRCIEALGLLKARGETRVRFHVIGDGEDAPLLERLARERDLADQVVFHGPLRFGPELFERLYDYDLMLAAPLSEDTPRSALDGMASGLPLLAFDTNYYRELAVSGAVDLVPWPDTEALAARIGEWITDRSRLAPMCRQAVAFARENTQDKWLERRLAWTLELIEQPAPESPVAAGAIGAAGGD